MQEVNGIRIYSDDPILFYEGLDGPPTWFSAQGGVYKCRERTGHKQVAIKKYLVKENGNEDMFVMPKELVENEIYTMTRCIHNNILKLLAVYIHQEFVYLVMPLCTGGSLQHYVLDNQLTVGQIVYVIRSIASGLEKLHGNGYIHRDIKCDNIFLDQEKNNIVIGDFGVVSISSTADSKLEEAGVVLFWAPELVRQKIVNDKIDIWALGIIILEILNGGRAPYEDEGLQEEQIKQRIIQVQRPAYPPKLPPQLVNLLDHCLDPNPNTRYSATQVLKHAFLNKYQPELLFSTKLPQNKKPKQAATSIKCRIPVRSFSLNKSVSASVPVKEKILDVYRKRQSLSDTSRSQGSRLPMLCIKQTIIEEKPKPVKEKKRALSESNAVSPTKNLQPPPTKAVSPNTNHKAFVKPLIKPMIPIKVLPSKRDPTTRKAKSVATLSSIPIKASIYQNKKSAGESRTARLTMGISTGRRESYKKRESSTETSLPMLAHKQKNMKEITKRQAISSLKGNVLRVY